jgi:hypothetical protein
MDGRVQIPVITFLQQRFKAEFVDSITEPGPIRVLADQDDQDRIQSILDRLKISLEGHGSKSVAVVGHEDCAGNPVDRDEQMGQIERSLQFLRDRLEGIEMIGLWVDEQWKVHEVA